MAYARTYDYLTTCVYHFRVGGLSFLPTRVISARPLDTWQHSEIFQIHKNFKIHMLPASF